MKPWLLLALTLMGVYPARAETLSLSEMLTHVMTSHPYLQAIEQQGEQQRFELESADAAFDPYVAQSVNSRLSGYYSGDVSTSEFSQPLSTMNGEVYSQYRIADGDFPDYNGQYDTLSGGEAAVGVRLSLLRGRETDDRRTAQQNARLAIERWQTSYLLGVNKLMYSAAMTYLDWYESHLKIERLNELRRTLEKQENVLVRKVEQGDEAQVVLQAFEANLLEIDLLKATERQKLQAAATKLFYYVPPKWVTRAEPVINSQQWPYQVNHTQLSDLRHHLTVHPLTDDLNLAIKQQRNKQRLAQNNLLPKLDMKAELARDLGSGPTSLMQTDTKVGLDFNYPLGNRKAKAKAAGAQAKLREMTFKLADAEQKLAQQFDTAVAKWQQSQDLTELNQQAAALAERLQAVEKTRFDIGDTDVFVLNARQITFIKAQLKLISAKVDELRAQLALYYVSAQLPAALVSR
ncbi:TolC family protein [Salinimonas chungwhensis]|uniref:TolC family protein n=1 Tax=Salinimonas chungwhensis TaxID=265425 RepID=UPI000372FD34|nr:TolC family protein [Salinimonas chungwhensis]